MFLRRNKKSIAKAASSELQWLPVTPEQQKRKLNLEVSAIMRMLDLPEANRADVRSAYVIAEDLALRQVEMEFDLPLLRHRAFEDAAFDGVAQKNNRIFCVEILFLVNSNLSEDRIEMLFNKAEYAAARVRRVDSKIKLELMLVLITQLTREDQSLLQSKLIQRFTTTLSDVMRQAKLLKSNNLGKSTPPVDFNIHFYDFETLQNTFLNE